MNDEGSYRAEVYKRLIEQGFNHTAKEYVEKFGVIQTDGWIRFNDGSRYNTKNGGTINPGDIIV